mmetsp:Transcript_1036/g.3227  ORF Transcript_1036/g.3227 Transcript_1036/m.3227 type:complete len:301 (+) Transcript_1036:1217-2119(+)
MWQYGHEPLRSNGAASNLDAGRHRGGTAEADVNRIPPPGMREPCAGSRTEWGNAYVPSCEGDFSGASAVQGGHSGYVYPSTAPHAWPSTGSGGGFQQSYGNAADTSHGPYNAQAAPFRVEDIYAPRAGAPEYGASSHTHQQPPSGYSTYVSRSYAGHHHAGYGYNVNYGGPSATSSSGDAGHPTHGNADGNQVLHPLLSQGGEQPPLELPISHAGGRVGVYELREGDRRQACQQLGKKLPLSAALPQNGLTKEILTDEGRRLVLSDPQDLAAGRKKGRTAKSTVRGIVKNAGRTFDSIHW